MVLQVFRQFVIGLGGSELVILIWKMKITADRPGGRPSTIHADFIKVMVDENP